MKKVIGILLFIQSVFFAQEVLTFDSELIPATDTVYVFLPDKYTDSDVYPLLYLLHGWDGNYDQWNSIMGGLRKAADQYGFIICCPDGFKDSWYVNSPLRSNSQFEKFFFTVLTPSLHNKYKIDTANIFISGLSMGGHGALTLFLKHSDYFNSAASTSGILDITQFPKNWGIADYLGSYDSGQETWKKNSVYYLLDNLDKNREFFFDCGTEDFAYKVNTDTYLRCRELGIKASFLSQPGTHNREYWKKALPFHFEYFKRCIKK